MLGVFLDTLKIGHSSYSMISMISILNELTLQNGIAKKIYMYVNNVFGQKIKNTAKYRGKNKKQNIKILARALN